MKHTRTRPVVVVAETLPEAVVAEIETWARLRQVDGTDRAALTAAVADASALIVRSATQVDAHLIRHASSLQAVGRAGVGLDNIDLTAAAAAGIAVVNAPTANAIAAAEHACALIMAAARRIGAASQQLKAGQWERSRHTGTQLADKTLAVIGYGQIGQMVAKRMAAFDMHIIAYDTAPSIASDVDPAERVSLEEALARADVISLHLPKTPDTLGLIDAERLRHTKPGVIIVNTSRGGIVDESALDAALRRGHVAAAGLDVFSSEPCTASPLFELDQVVVTPHLGASTREAQLAAARDTAQAVQRVLSTTHHRDAATTAA